MNDQDIFNFLNGFKVNKNKAIQDYIDGKITKEQLDKVMQGLKK